MLSKPPLLPPLNDDNSQISHYLRELESWSQEVYSRIRFFNIGDVAITAGTGVPSGGQDGDWYFRVAGANTTVYQNINGVWTENT